MKSRTAYLLFAAGLIVAALIMDITRVEGSVYCPAPPVGVIGTAFPAVASMTPRQTAFEF